MVQDTSNVVLKQLVSKLDGVVAVDNRPSTDKLHHFVQNENEMWNEMWHVTCDMQHVTHDMWHVVGCEHSLKISAP